MDMIFFSCFLCFLYGLSTLGWFVHHGISLIFLISTFELASELTIIEKDIFQYLITNHFSIYIYV